MAVSPARGPWVGLAPRDTLCATGVDLATTTDGVVGRRCRRGGTATRARCRRNASLLYRTAAVLVCAVMGDGGSGRDARSRCWRGDGVYAQPLPGVVCPRGSHAALDWLASVLHRPPGIAADPKSPFVVKAQIHAGGRGKGTFDTGFKGGVHVVNKCVGSTTHRLATQCDVNTSHHQPTTACVALSTCHARRVVRVVVVGEGGVRCLHRHGFASLPLPWGSPHVPVVPRSPARRTAATGLTK